MSKLPGLPVVEVAPGWQHKHPIGVGERLVQLFDKNSHSHVDIPTQVKSFPRIHVIENVSGPFQASCGVSTAAGFGDCYQWKKQQEKIQSAGS